MSKETPVTGGSDSYVDLDRQVWRALETVLWVGSEGSENFIHRCLPWLMSVNAPQTVDIRSVFFISSVVSVFSWRRQLRSWTMLWLRRKRLLRDVVSLTCRLVSYTNDPSCLRQLDSYTVELQRYTCCWMCAHLLNVAPVGKALLGFSMSSYINNKINHY